MKAKDEILKELQTRLLNLNQHISLGRHEDLLRINEIKIVELKELDLLEDNQLKHSMYIPTSKIDESEISTGIPYVLNWTYELKNGVRDWRKIPVLLFEKNKLINDDLMDSTVFCDDEEYIVIWNE